MIKPYYSLIKPGIVYGNLLTAAAGFLLASKGSITIPLLIATLLGISLIIASGCVFNNYIDRDIDARMERTKNRPLVQGVISGRAALLYASFLGILGSLLLILYTNVLTLAIALFGLFMYVFPYSLWSKRYSMQATIIGSFAGAVPPVVGYCAVSNSFNLAALILFFILVFWQMPHAFSIAIYRIEDYAAAAIPVLPIAKGIGHTKMQMLLYVSAFSITASLLWIFRYTGYSYLAVLLVLSLGWIGLAVEGFWSADDTRWARRMFIYSMAVIVSFCISIALL